MRIADHNESSSQTFLRKFFSRLSKLAIAMDFREGDLYLSELQFLRKRVEILEQARK